MAEALLGVVFENLLSLVQNEFATISGIKSKALKLSTTLDLIKAVLEDAEKKQITDRSIKAWLQQLKDAMHILDDILDECSIQSTQLKGISSFTLKNIMFRHKIGTRFKEIQTDSMILLKVKTSFFYENVLLLGKGRSMWMNGVKLALLSLNQKYIYMVDKMIKRRLSSFFSPKQKALTSFPSIQLLA